MRKTDSLINPFSTVVPFWGQTTYNYEECFVPIYGSAVLKGLKAYVPGTTEGHKK